MQFFIVSFGQKIGICIHNLNVLFFHGVLISTVRDDTTVLFFPHISRQTAKVIVNSRSFFCPPFLTQ